MSATPLPETTAAARKARPRPALFGITLADWLRIAVHIGALIPLALLLWDGAHNHLTANPIQEITFRTGKTAIILLILSLLCTPLNILFGWKVVLPLVMPALMAASMFAVTLAWKEFIFAYIFLSKDKLYTLTIGMAQMIIGDVLPWGELSAAALLMSIPVAILYMVGQRYMVAGLTAGAVKG